MIRTSLMLLLLTILVGCTDNSAEGGDAPFDFYVFALSWSPSYCEAEGRKANAQQCRKGGPSGFVVHGLWPQYEQGYPEYCALNDDGRFFRHELAALRDLFPSNGLIRHQWRKHGSCTGLTRAEYFTDVRKARDRIRIPAMFDEPATGRNIDPNRVEAAFRQDNPGLAADAIAVTCEEGRIRDVRICMNRDFEFRSCAEIDRRFCRLPQARLPVPLRDQAENAAR